ncbi:hypothetical protein [Bradyrhizobium sp. Ash2021]|uniref:hypothetical protein n=1 Tax=Bradyrhizobium sp. Ash2021 TaxID=2954771 RepID=UPI0028149A35|nr:hypothetical protein [Bradyrhizobium sp. Ash2021]WMT79504.1 hypothetical protein NL528_46495 [Bradyrhizobium sp. Ash2021]
MSVLSEQDRTTPHDPLYYAPRRLREMPRSPAFNELHFEPDNAPAQRRTSADIALENAVYQSLRRPLEPEVMDEPSTPRRDRNGRKMLFVAAAVGVSAVAALFYVLWIQTPQESSIAASFAAAVQSIKTVRPQQSPGQTVTPEQSEELLQQFMQWRQKTRSAETSQ